MKAALLAAVGKLTITEVEQPDLGRPSDVLIRVGAVGICGSEIHAFQGTHPFRKPPSILGHEVAGEVVDVGAKVSGLAPGDRVFVNPQRTCGECEWCQSGRPNVCSSREMLGTLGWTGGLAEYIVAPAQNVCPLPDHVSYVQGTLIEPLCVGVHAIRRAGVEAGESIAVLGTGPIGMMVAAAASVRDACPIIVVDVKQHCLDVARDHLGATHILLADERPLADRVLYITRDKGISAAFVTVGVPELMDDALGMIERQGRIVLIANFDDPPPLRASDVMHRELAILGSITYNAEDVRTALDLIASGRVEAEAMVTHVLPLQDVQRGFDLAATKADGAIKVVVAFEDMVPSSGMDGST